MGEPGLARRPFESPMTDNEVHRSLAALHPASAGWALSCCRWDREAAEEVLQVTYLKILDGRARFGGRSSFQTWLFGVIRRTAAEHRRGRWLRSAVGLRWREEPSSPPPPSPETLLGEAESGHALRAALRRLPARQREVLHLVFYQEMTLDEAARVLGISPGSARTHYHRGKDALQQRLGREGKP
jgi:RNA polymerase sigma-70 factor (ECF subfamily)